MIDIESQVFNTVAVALRASFPGITIYGEEVESPSSFPSVTLIERENSEIGGNRTLSRTAETASNLMYEVNVYSNLKTGKKAQAKSIISTIDEQMRYMGFERTLCEQLTNLLDRTIYRIVAHYSRTIQTF